MIKFVLMAFALALETSAISTVLLSGSSDSVLILFLLQHAAASTLLALSGWYFIPERFRYPRWMITLIFFNFSFFIPLLGLLGVFTAVLFSGYRRHEKTSLPFAKLIWPEFVLSLREPEIKFSQGGIKSRLAESSIPTTKRLQSLLALQGIPARVSSPLLQDMLGDASDDIRLVAYGLLDSREKKITAQIHRELVNLRNAESKEMQLVVLRHLAELYWEMVYAGLALGDLRTHTLNQALAYADDALKLAQQDTGLQFLKGRILHELKRYEEAQLILESAMSRGLPESRVLPYIVEIAFDRGDYKTVQRLLSRISVSQITPIMKNSINFWVNGRNLKVPLLAKEKFA
jgi:hypothetical protein